MVSEQEPDLSGNDPGRVEELYERARQLPAGDRTSFLREACGDDTGLEQELRSLLAHGELAEAFFAGLSGGVISPAIGERIRQYQLIGILGSGGMGTVYRAHDARLDRVVALKFLPPYLSADRESHERFLVEARAAAALEHPNICSIHEIGETTDGRPFIAMACYEGETLKERLRRGPLPPVEAMDIAVQLARGLGAAHARNIVHRDVKPGNIMLVADGSMRLLDFGVAKVADVNLTGPGGTPGTIAYMSPEQVRGDAVGAAADLWSLGVVLYEMLAGTRPFRGGNDRAIVQAILHDQPDLKRAGLRDVPPPALRIIERLLQKAPDDRFGSASELLDELTRPTPADGVERVFGWMRKRMRSLAVSGAAVLGLVALVSLVRPGSRSGPMTSGADAPAQPTVAVLPFAVRGPGLDVWREGMVDLLSMGLDGAAGIRTIDSRTLLATWHQEIGDSSGADLARALGVARRTQARYALVGSVVGAGPRIRLAADVYDAGSGRPVGQVQVDGPSDSVLTLVDRLGMQTLGLILAKDSSELPVLDLSAITTPSLLALKSYLEGDAHYRRSEFHAASEAWERAVRADTTFALAYLGLADAYGWYKAAEFYERNLGRANRLSARLPERERVKVQMRWARYTGVPGAFASIQGAVRRYPDAADAWYELGEAYYHDGVPMSGPAETEAAFRKAAELQPAMAPYRVHLVDLAFAWRPDSARIARELAAYGRLAPADARTRAGQVALALAFGGGRARDSARAVIGTLDPDVARQVYLFLEHPRFASVRDTVFPVLASRFSGQSRTNLLYSQLMNLVFMDGRIRDALKLLDDPATPAEFRFCGPLYFSARGIPVPEHTIEERRAAILADSFPLTSRDLVLCAADYASRSGDWSRHAELVARARTSVAWATAAGDSARGRDWQQVVRVAEAYGLWRRGRKAEALRDFESTLAGDRGQESLWYVGLLALDLGKLDEAEHAFRALWAQRDGAPAYLQLGRILERTGRRDEARDAYRFVAYAWRQADPELQPQVDEARRAVARLSGAGN